MGKAPDPQEYTCSEDNGITVCVRNDVVAIDDTITIGSAKLLFRENLTVEGLAF